MRWFASSQGQRKYYRYPVPSTHLALKSRPFCVDIALGNGGPATAEHRRHRRSDHPALADDDRILPHDAHSVHGQ